jgi:hypothetical protein
MGADGAMDLWGQLGVSVYAVDGTPLNQAYSFSNHNLAFVLPIGFLFTTTRDNTAS